MLGRLSVSGGEPTVGDPVEKRLLLDTNLWRYVVERRQLQVLRAAAKEHRARVLVAPAVVYEMLRTTDPALRKELVRAATLLGWTRLMPEAYSESMDVLAVLRKRRP